MHSGCETAQDQVKCFMFPSFTHSKELRKTFPLYTPSLYRFLFSNVPALFRESRFGKPFFCGFRTAMKKLKPRENSPGICWLSQVKSARQDVLPERGCFCVEYWFGSNSQRSRYLAAFLSHLMNKKSIGLWNYRFEST